MTMGSGHHHLYQRLTQGTDRLEPSPIFFLSGIWNGLISTRGVFDLFMSVRLQLLSIVLGSKFWQRICWLHTTVSQFCQEDINSEDRCGTINQSNFKQNDVFYVHGNYTVFNSEFARPKFARPKSRAIRMSRSTGLNVLLHSASLGIGMSNYPIQNQ